jgi:hypothetical protein
MKNFIDVYNKKINKLNYRLGDSIRFNNIGSLNQNCIAYKYHSNSENIFIGSSEKNTKIIKLNKPYQLDTQLNFYSVYKDTFSYLFSEKELKVTRTDADTGWGQQLIGYISHKNVKLNAEEIKNRKNYISYNNLYNIVIKTDYILCPKNSILFHLRLYDWINWVNAAKTSIKDYEIFIEKYKDLIAKLDNVFLLYGGCNKNEENIKKTNEFINSLMKILKKYNSNVFNITSENTDQDFKYMVTSEYYVPSLGGFSNLAGAINKNTVYWDLSEKFINQYKSSNDKNDIKNFKDFNLDCKTKTNAIVVLTRGYSNIIDYNKLIERNKILENTIMLNTDYIIFHEGNIPVEHQTYISNKTPSLDLQFINVEKDFKKIYTDIDPRTKGFSLGYRNMCNFWFSNFWKYTEKYEKVVRIDEDIKLYSDVNFIFNKLNTKIACYGSWQNDCDWVTRNLNNTTLQFFKKKYNEDKVTRNPSGPYTNVIGWNLKELRKNNKIFEYIDEVVKTNMIYYNRWGDLPLWGEILFYLYDKEDYSECKEIKYYHGSNNVTYNV